MFVEYDTFRGEMGLFCGEKDNLVGEKRHFCGEKSLFAKLQSSSNNLEFDFSHVVYHIVIS